MQAASQPPRTQANAFGARSTTPARPPLQPAIQQSSAQEGKRVAFQLPSGAIPPPQGSNGSAPEQKQESDMDAFAAEFFEIGSIPEHIPPAEVC